MASNGSGRYDPWVRERAAAIICVVAVAACGLEATGSLAPTLGGETDAGIDVIGDSSAGPIDASSTEDAPSTLPDGSASDAGPDVVEGPSFCQEASLIACYRFEGAITDESAPPIGAPTTSADVTYVAGPPGHGKAFRSQADTVLQLPDDPTWDSTDITLEFWVNIQSLPVSPARGGIFDNSRNYAVFILASGVARCGTANLDSTVLPLKTWTHVACVWNATQSTVTVYVNGQQTGTVSSGLMPIASTEPAAIGSNIPSGDPLDGMIDGLRIFSSVRTATEIAAAAK